MLIIRPILFFYIYQEAGVLGAKHLRKQILDKLNCTIAYFIFFPLNIFLLILTFSSLLNLICSSYFK